MSNGINQTPFKDRDLDLIDYYQRCYGVYDNQRHVSAVVKTSFEKSFDGKREHDAVKKTKRMVNYLNGLDFE